MKRELVFTAYNRPNYLAESIASWNNVRSLNMWPATFYIEPSELTDEITNVAFQLNTTVTAVVNESKQGVLVNPWNAFEGAFSSGADFVVLAEDDVLVSQDILEFFEWTSVEYQTSYSTLAVNAFSKNGGDKDNQLWLRSTFSPLIWGTWRDRWYHHLRDTWDKDYSTGLPDGSQAGWDWNINRIIKANNFNVVAPLNSRSDHIGLENGTHTTAETFYYSQGESFSLTRGKQRYTEI